MLLVAVQQPPPKEVPLPPYQELLRGSSRYSDIQQRLIAAALDATLCRLQEDKPGDPTVGSGYPITVL